ncbi:MAG TPA: site-specific integrase [Acidimicrobiales bacterium]
MASIDRRPNGKWRARRREYPGGPQRAKHFGRKLDAERHLVLVQHQLLSGTYVTPEAGRVTLSAFADVYLARQPWRPSTGVAAGKAFVHIRRTFGDRPLSSIRKGDVQAFVTGLSLAPTTVALVFQHLNALLEGAVEDGLIARNPARGVKLPAQTVGDLVPPTVEQVEELYASAVTWFRPAVVLGAGLGLRQAEACGLTADRVLWLARSVRVDRQWNSRQRPADFAPPKTRSSDRTVPASSYVLDVLAEHVGRRHVGFVLHRAGEPADWQAFGHQWRQARKRAGLDGIRYHDLRHAFASMLISAGCSVKAVSRALGHASAATTLNLYSHLWPGDEDRIRDAVDLALAPKAEDRLRTEGER